MSDTVLVAVFGLVSIIGAEFLRQRGVFGQTDTQRITTLWTRVDKMQGELDRLRSFIPRLLSDVRRRYPEYEPSDELKADFPEFL